MTPNSKTATITVAVAGRRPRKRHPEYTRLLDAIEHLNSITTPNKWLKRLLAIKLAQARAYVTIHNLEEGLQ